MSNPPVQQQYIEQVIADQLEELMVDIGRIPNRSRSLNIVMGILAALAKFLQVNNLRGLKSVACVCDRELRSIKDSSCQRTN